MKTVRVLLVDDHQIFRDGIVSMFDAAEGVSLIGVLGDPWETLGKIDKLQPDVLVLDLSMPGLSGIELLERLRAKGKEVKALVLSMHTQTDYVKQALAAGALGYLPKQDTTRQELIRAILDVAEGKEYIHESIRQQLDTEGKLANSDTGKSLRDLELLSPREMEVLKLVVEGLSNQEICQKLDVNIRTVETHKTNILQKLDLKNSVELVKFAIRNKLVEL
jgi:DNA-binding NarL/FixJ family response regulator